MTTQQPANLDVAPSDTPVIVRCKGCKRVTRTTKGAHSFDVSCSCGEPGGYVRMSLLRATVVDTVGCDVKCEYAVGATCRCSCGGDRHATGHKN